MKKVRIYRIYTEKKVGIEKLISFYFDGFSILNAIGYWKGQREDSIVIEIITNDNNKVKALVQEIKKTNRQECVLVTIGECKAIFA